MVFGYFLYEATALGYGIGALGAIPGNLVQAVGGIVISVLVMELIKNNRHDHAPDERISLHNIL